MPIAERMNYLAPSFQDLPDSLRDEFNKVMEWLREVEDSPSEVNFRTEAMEDYRFYAGDQDTAEVKADLIDQKRPNSTFNETKPKVDMLIGLGAQVKYDGHVIPVGEEDEPLSELANGTLLHYRKKSKMGRKELDCFEHMTKAGRSLLYFRINKENPFKPKIEPIRIPGYNFAIDPASVEYDLSDAKYLFVWNWVDEEDLKAIDEDIDPKVLSMAGPLEQEVPTFYDNLIDKYRVVECWYRSWEKLYWFQNPLTGQVEGVKKSQYTAFVRALMQGIANPDTGEITKIDQPIPYSVAYGVTYRYMVFSGNYVIESGDSPYHKKVGFPAVLYGAYKNDDENRWFGAITMMKDPQRSVNTMRRQLVHLLQTLPKGILIHETGAILDIEKYEQRSAEPNFHLEVMTGYIDKVKFEKQPSISPVYQMLDEIMRQSIKDSSGVHDDLMGIYTASREPGITVQTRQQSNLAVLFIVFNNYRESRLEGNRKFLYLLQQFVQAPEIIRIQGQKGMELWRINTQLNPQSQGFNDFAAGEYDLEMEETVETGTFRAAIAQMLIEFSHNNPGTIPPDIILQYMDIPFTVKNAIREYWLQQQQLEQENKDADRAVEIMKAKAMSDRAVNRQTETKPKSKEGE